jgi:hypothetical protein
MPQRILHDLVPLVKGNIEHVTEVRALHRNLELDTVHREWMVCIGRGFDFLHIPIEVEFLESICLGGHYQGTPGHAKAHDQEIRRTGLAYAKFDNHRPLDLTPRESS